MTETFFFFLTETFLCLESCNVVKRVWAFINQGELD